MSEQELLDEARRAAAVRHHSLTPFVRKGTSFDSRCLTCARQVYVMPDPGRKGAAIGGDALSDSCIRKRSASVKLPISTRKAN
jgi:hypothetical protein